ncbi:mitochondrial 37S ribosomal protein rsm10 [Claviceps africana]|uniref:Small ribosomal subunit protein uS10m n=1 Tax=Claviceps africana TaxID=83212 RepID=A0A8K0JD98_9HYPO|nr:mitochondrial 37S ribosomal protein rsm10 [Claviceps africana]
MRVSLASRFLGATAADHGCKALMRSATHSTLGQSSMSLLVGQETRWTKYDTITDHIGRSPKREQDIARRSYSTSPDRPDPSTERQIRLPRSLQSIHLKPLKREAKFGIPSCDLQLRSFSIQPLEFFSDFALRAAYYLGLPAYGPVPLPRLTERWTVPKSHFIFKKAQENFERVTLRRLIQIKDGHPETVQLWLAYLRKHQFYGVGMKANVWEFGPTGVGLNDENGTREKQLEEVDSLWSHLGQTKTLGTSAKVEELLNSRLFQEANGLRQPPSISGS